MARGGKRKGAGRKLGSTVKPHIRDFWSKEEIKEFFESLYKRQKKNDRLAIWCADQLSGKAVQPIGNDGDDAFKIEGNVEVTFRKAQN